MLYGLQRVEHHAGHCGPPLRSGYTARRSSLARDVDHVGGALVRHLDAVPQDPRTHPEARRLPAGCARGP